MDAKRIAELAEEARQMCAEPGIQARLYAKRYAELVEEASLARNCPDKVSVPVPHAKLVTIPFPGEVDEWQIDALDNSKGKWITVTTGCPTNMWQVPGVAYRFRVAALATDQQLREQQLQRLPELRHFDGLRELYLNCSGWSSLDGVQHLRSLRALFLDNCFDLGERQVAPLRELTQLESLTINCPNLTDDSLVYLRSLSRLQHLRLGWYKERGTLGRMLGLTGITKAALMELRRSLIGCEVDAMGF